MELIILILIVSLVYLFSMQGITCCNSGSLYALVRAIVEKKKLAIKEYLGYTNFMDYAKKNDKYYSDRPPGLAFASVPFHALGLNVVLVPVISGILSTVLVYLITLQLVGIEKIALITGLIFALCTINWRYSTTFIIHPLSAFLVLLSVYFLLNGYPFFVIGLILGLATIVEYTDFMFLFGIGLAQIILGNYSVLFPLGGGYVLGVVPLFLYNWRCFGSPLTTSYKYSAHFRWSNSLRTTFVTPILKGIFGLLFHIKKKKEIFLPGGMLVLSPVLIFGIIGFYYLSYENLILFLCLTLPLFLLVSKHKTYWAGGGGDYRYLSAMIPYIVIPIGLLLENNFVLWPGVLIFSLASFMIVAIKMSVLTIKIDDLKKINSGTGKEKISKLLKIKDIPSLVGLVFKGIFIRKINLEKCSPEKASKELSKKQEI
ncbi:hypothetical protein CMI44_01280 [Candidatus Pacearchaeota archaeon]|nr:hypothetical protein [Candidatus Pacearchaeota archaeon]